MDSRCLQELSLCAELDMVSALWCQQLGRESCTLNKYRVNGGPRCAEWRSVRGTQTVWLGQVRMVSVEASLSMWTWELQIKD
jgi:hypothetical protein